MLCKFGLHKQLVVNSQAGVSVGHGLVSEGYKDIGGGVYRLYRKDVTFHFSEH